MPNQTGKDDSSAHDFGAGSKEWVCLCGQLLGLQHFDEIWGVEALHIKVKDVTIVSVGGPGSRIRRNCPRCGRTVGLKGE